jgi:hypothetical protein
MAGATLAAAPGKLSSGEIEAAFTGRTLHIRTEKVTTGDPTNPSGTVRRTDGGHIRFQLVVRPDRSILFRCTFFDRAGRSSVCARPGAHTRDIGVWSVERDTFCFQWLTARGSQKACLEVLRDGERHRFRQVSGPPALVDGEAVEIR